jgi:N6-adenosine-specific RNA methylase IME4
MDRKLNSGREGRQGSLHWTRKSEEYRSFYIQGNKKIKFDQMSVFFQHEGELSNKHIRDCPREPKLGEHEEPKNEYKVTNKGTHL